MSILISLIYLVLVVFQFILLARVLLSWFPNFDRSNPIIRFIYGATEPVLSPIRNLLPAMGGLDFSPLIVFLLISLIVRFLG